MKKLIACLALAILAQAQTMKIYFKDHSSYGVPLFRLDSVHFDSSQMRLDRKDFLHPRYDVDAIDSVVYLRQTDTSVQYGTLIDDRDHQAYKTVMVGKRRWMAQNLNYGQWVRSTDTMRDSRVEKVCWMNDSTACSKLGGLYSWSEAMALPKSCDSLSCTSKKSKYYQGICPAGWRVPTDGDWLELESNIGMSAASRDSLGISRGAPLGAILRNNWSTFGFGVQNTGGMDPFGAPVDTTYHQSFYLSSSEYGPYTAWARAFLEYEEYFEQADTGLVMAVRSITGIARAPVLFDPNAKTSSSTLKNGMNSLRCVESMPGDEAEIASATYQVQVLNPQWGSYRLRDSATVYEGDTSMVYALPNWGYKVKAWTRNGQIVSTSNRLVVRELVPDAVYQLEFEADSNQSWMTDSRDGQVYKTLMVGPRKWMAQSLNYGQRMNSNQVDLLDYSSDGQKFCAKDLDSNCAKYGGLYTPKMALAADSIAAEPVRGICPIGWHLSTDREWNEMELSLGMPASDTNKFGYGRASTVYSKLCDAQSWQVGMLDEDCSNDSYMGLMAWGGYPLGLNHPWYAEGDAASFVTSSKTRLFGRSVSIVRVLRSQYFAFMRSIDANYRRLYSIRCVQD